MEFIIRQRDFLRGLARTHAVADRKSSMAILSNILLTAEGSNRLRLAATDLYLGVSAISDADVKRPGSITVAARTLFDIVKAMPDGDIHWTVDDNQACTLKQGRIRYTIPGLAADDFPPLPNPGEAEFVDLDAATVSELIGLTSYSMSSDDTRPHLAGALFEVENARLRMVTTDGHRLSKAEVGIAETANYSMLIPHKGINELKRVLDDTKGAKGADQAPILGVAVAGGNAFFRRDELMLSVKLADEQFPPYDKVIPQQQTKRVVALRTRLLDALRRISLVAADKSCGVQLHVSEGVLRIQSQNPDVGEGAEDVQVDYAGESVAIGFNARYLMDALGALSHDEVALELSGELDPGVVKPVGEGVDYVGVIMPMRV